MLVGSWLEIFRWRRLTPNFGGGKLAWLPQFPYLFHTSIEENIRLTKPGASTAEVVAAARKANADEFISGFSDGYHTGLGERGTRLSGGQAQRIALARAFLKEAPLMILDEPGANLDVESHELIHDALERALERRTALIIAHRLSTIKGADQIVVLDQGRVAQVGSHHDLIKTGGVYSTLIGTTGSGN